MCEIVFYFLWMLKMLIGCLLFNVNCILYVLKYKVLLFFFSDMGVMFLESCVFG